MVPFSSCSLALKLSLKSHQMRSCFVQNDKVFIYLNNDDFTQTPFLNKRSWYLMTSKQRLQCERPREREEKKTRNSAFRWVHNLVYLKCLVFTGYYLVACKWGERKIRPIQVILDRWPKLITMG